jgi:hypothetical protein
MTIELDCRVACAVRHVYESSACIRGGSLISYQFDMRIPAGGMKRLHMPTIIATQDGLAASGLEDGRYHRIIERRHSALAFQICACAR